MASSDEAPISLVAALDHGKGQDQQSTSDSMHDAMTEVVSSETKAGTPTSLVESPS